MENYYFQSNFNRGDLVLFQDVSKRQYIKFAAFFHPQFLNDIFIVLSNRTPSAPH